MFWRNKKKYHNISIKEKNYPFLDDLYKGHFREEIRLTYEQLKWNKGRIEIRKGAERRLVGDYILRSEEGMKVYRRNEGV